MHLLIQKKDLKIEIFNQAVIMFSQSMSDLFLL